MTTLPQTTPVYVPQQPGYSPAAPSAPTPNFAPTQISARASGGGGLTGADILRVLRANALLISLVLLVSILVGVGLHFLLLRVYPRYKASGTIIINTQITKDLLKGEVEGISDQRLVAELRTQERMLTNDGLFTAVLQKDGPIRNTSWYKNHLKSDGQGGMRLDIRAAKEDLIDDFTATVLPDTTLVQISMSGSVPEDCKTIVEDIVNTHLERQKSQAEARMNGQSSALERLYDRYTQQIRIVTTRVRDSQVRLTTKGLNAVNTSYFSTKERELALVIEEKAKVSGPFQEAKNMLERVTQEIATGKTPSEVENAVEQDNTIESLKVQLTNMEIQLANATQNVGPQSREAVKLTGLIEVTRQKIEEQKQQIRLTKQSLFLEKLRSMAAATQADYETVNTKYDLMKKDLSEASREMANLLIDQEEERALRELQRQVGDKIRDLQAVISMQAQSKVDWASVPEKPEIAYFPRWWIVVPAVALLGLIVSLGFAFLRELSDDTIRSPRDLDRLGGAINFLGTIPDERDDHEAAGVRLPIFDAPHSITAEHFRALRTRLQHAAPTPDSLRTIMVTGPSAGDGKTTVAVNLAASIALNGRRVLLVDANFRRPEIHQIFGLNNARGFSDVINGSASLDETVQQSRIPNLTILVSGPKPMNAAELFESQLLSDFIDKALEEYDQIVFDTGPFLIVSESQAMAPRVDGVLAVVRAHGDRRGQVDRMRSMLGQVRARPLGVVINAVRARGGGYYRSNIREYYLYNS